MASSQVTIHSFGFILRDRNQNPGVSQKNVKPLVKNHHRHDLFKSPVSDENSENLVDSWIETRNKKDNDNNHIRLTEKPLVRKSRVLESPVESLRKEKSEESKRNDNLGASSLVQIWEARLNRSNGVNSPINNQSTASSNRSDSGVSVQGSEFAVEYEVAEIKNADRTAEIESGSHGLVSDTGESKWGRVADLIRKLSSDEKLTAEDNGCGGGGLAIIKTPKFCNSSSSSSEKSNFSMVNFSPRIRGRQAFTDLVVQMERDRHRELDSLLERNAVSRFTQRGRLQSMLKLRNLKRCLAIQDRTRSSAITTGLNRIESGSTVQHLREKFRANAVITAVAADQRKNHQRSTKTNKESERLKKGSVTLEASFEEGLSLCKREIEKATSCKEEETVKGTVKSKTNCLQLQETREMEETCNDSEYEKTSQSACIAQESRLRQKQSENKIEHCVQETQTQGVVIEMDQCLEQQETSYLNGWEEQEEYEDEQFYYGETNNDWLSEISRPRSYWEELRKSRYLEVMNTRSEKEDIRRLLERRTVTDFLESDLREKIESLMMSRVQTHSNKHSEKWELQQEEEEETNEGEEDRDDLSRSSSSQIFASSPAGSWSSQDTEVTSTLVLPAHNPNSPEMELIISMRSEIQQLQQEMSLLRDSVKTCLDANASLQQSVQRENPLKRKCCACNETQVETVLYRCGHMCMCLKCANELHWSGGKCPICRAQIMDVVRVFFDSRN